MAARGTSSETYTLTGPGRDPLALHDGFGAAVSRALTAAQHPRSAEPAEFHLHGENGRLVARVVRDGLGHAEVWASDRGIEDSAAHSPRASSTRRPDPPAAEGSNVTEKASSQKKRSGGKRGSTAKRTSRTSPARSSAAAAMSHVSAKDAVRDVLQAAGKALPTSEIVSGVLATEGVTLKGKTPAATIAAILSIENGKADGLFVRVEKGTYDLRDRQAAAA